MAKVVMNEPIWRAPAVLRRAKAKGKAREARAHPRSYRGPARHIATPHAAAVLECSREGAEREKPGA